MHVLYSTALHILVCDLVPPHQTHLYIVLESLSNVLGSRFSQVGSHERGEDSIGIERLRNELSRELPPRRVKELSSDDEGDLRAVMRLRVMESDGSSVGFQGSARVERLRNELSLDLPPRRVKELSGDDEGDLRAAMSKRVKESDGSSVCFPEQLAPTMDCDVDGEWVAGMAS